MYWILTENAASDENMIGGGQNGYLELILQPYQYSHLEANPFEHPDKPGCTAKVTDW